MTEVIKDCTKCEYYNAEGRCWAIIGIADPTNPRCDYREKGVLSEEEKLDQENLARDIKYIRERRMK